MSTVRKPLPSFPEVTDKKPSVPPSTPEGAAVFEKFQSTLMKLSESGSQLDAIRLQARDLLTEEELAAYFEMDADNTQKIILPGDSK